MRRGFLSELSTIGHDVTVLGESRLIYMDAFDSWRKKYNIKFSPYEYPKKGLDVLIVEGGHIDLRMKMRVEPTHQRPHIVHCNLMLAQHEGFVAFWGYDYQRNYPLVLEDLGPSYFLKGYGKLCSSLDLTRNKTWFLATSSYNLKRYAEAASAPRHPYTDLGIEAKFVPTMQYHYPEKPLLPSRDPKWNLMYLGGQKSSSRLQMFKDYYLQSKGVAVIGRWEQDVIDHLKRRVDFRGTLGGEKDVPTLLHQALASVHIGESDRAYIGDMTTRYFEVIGSGALCFVPVPFNFRIQMASLGGIVKRFAPVIPTELEVSVKNFKDKLEYVKNLSYGGRLDLQARQRGATELLEPNVGAQQFERVIRNLVHDPSQNIRHEKYLEKFLRLLAKTPQGKVKADAFRSNWNINYYKRVCPECGREVAMDISAAKTRCVECGGRFKRVKRFPRT
jgi:hypothetical protein